MILALAAGRAGATLELRVASLILGCVVALCWVGTVYVERRKLSDTPAMMTDSSDGQEGQ